MDWKRDGSNSSLSMASTLSSYRMCVSRVKKSFDVRGCCFSQTGRSKAASKESVNRVVAATEECARDELEARPDRGEAVWLKCDARCVWYRLILVLLPEASPPISDHRLPARALPAVRGSALACILQSYRHTTPKRTEQQHLQPLQRYPHQSWATSTLHELACAAAARRASG